MAVTLPGIAAYAQAMRRGLDGAAAAEAPAISGASNGPSFADLVQDAVGDVVTRGRASEANAMAALAGKGDLVDVVAAVSQAEISLQTVVSIRDKVIAAYQDIMKMPI
jgi:flagellar hook-basal body complex protein FliE